jgi:hypothetical protein
MFVKKLVTLDSIISDLVDMTDDEVIRMKPTLHKWAIESDKRIRTYYEYKRKKVTVTVANCCIPIPCDAVFLKYISLGDPGCDCYTIWNTLNEYNGITESSWSETVNGQVFDYTFSWYDGSSIVPVHFDWEIQGNDIVISNANLNGQTVTLLYYGYQEDVNGNYLVWNTHADPISLYLQKFIAEKLQWKNFKRMKLSNAEFMYIDNLDTAYHRAVRHCRANDAESSPPTDDHVFAMINNPISGKGNLYL